MLELTQSAQIELATGAIIGLSVALDIRGILGQLHPRYETIPRRELYVIIALLDTVAAFGALATGEVLLACILGAAALIAYYLARQNGGGGNPFRLKNFLPRWTR